MMVRSLWSVAGFCEHGKKNYNPICGGSWETNNFSV